MFLGYYRNDRKEGGRQRQNSGDNNSLKIERRDQSKQIKKGGNNGGQKKISIESLRKGDGKGKGNGNRDSNKGGNKGGDAKQRDHTNNKGERRNKFNGGDRKKKGGRGDKKAGEKKPVDAAARAEELDKELEGYWVKGGHSDLGKYYLIALMNDLYLTSNFTFFSHRKT